MPLLPKLRRVLATLAVLMLLVQAAYAQVCRQELTASLPDQVLERTPTGMDAAQSLKRAVELVEPALPPLRNGVSVPLPEEDEGYGTVKYLVERRLLPDSWRPEQIDAETWAQMLSTFLSWYELPGVDPGAPATADELISDLSTVLADVSSAIRPAALLATDPNAEGRTTFWAIIWNWTIYPRLLVHRPSGDASIQPQEALPRLGNCAVYVDAFISAPEDIARRLFLAHNTSRMYVVASDPHSDSLWPYQVPQGEELDAFIYRLDDLSGVEVYAAV